VLKENSDRVTIFGAISQHTLWPPVRPLHRFAESVDHGSLGVLACAKLANPLNEPASRSDGSFVRDHYVPILHETIRLNIPAIVSILKNGQAVVCMVIARRIWLTEQLDDVRKRVSARSIETAHADSLNGTGNSFLLRFRIAGEPEDLRRGHCAEKPTVNVAPLRRALRYHFTTSKAPFAPT
jgi:hypothetical protein